MTLGLLVVGACGRLYMSTLGNAGATQRVARLQESGRLALELMGRDIRAAGDVLCDPGQAVDNLLAERDRAFWGTFGAPLAGSAGAAGTHFEDPGLDTGAGVGQRLPDTPALRLWTVQPLALAVSAAPLSAQPLPVRGGQPPEVGSVLLACDFNMAALFRVTASGATIGHGTPDNCVDHFAVRGSCAAQAIAPEAQHRFGPDAAFGLPRQVRWFVGNDEDDEPALYRQELLDGVVVGGGAVASGVGALQLRYLLAGGAGYVPAAQVADAEWRQVQAVHVQLTLQQDGGASSDAPFVRDFQQTFSVRTRLP